MKWGYKCGEGKGAYRETREGGKNEGVANFEKNILFFCEILDKMSQIVPLCANEKERALF